MTIGRRIDGGYRIILKRRVIRVAIRNRVGAGSALHVRLSK